MLIKATRFLPTDAGSIPTGELRNVRGTPFDFLKLTAIGARINQDEEQLKLGNGYDHTWIINGRPGTLRLAAQAYEPTSGRNASVDHRTRYAVLYGKLSGRNANSVRKDLSTALRLLLRDLNIIPTRLINPRFRRRR